MSTDMISSMLLMFVVFMLVLILFGFTKSASNSDREEENLTLSVLKNVVFKLFLFAEKQEWSNAEKMEWCLKEIRKQFPYIPLTDATIEKMAQDLYDEYKDFVLKITQG